MINEVCKGKTAWTMGKSDKTSVSSISTRRSEIVVIQGVTLVLVVAVFVRIIVSPTIARQVPVRCRFEATNKRRFRTGVGATIRRA